MIHVSFLWLDGVRPTLWKCNQLFYLVAIKLYQFDVDRKPIFLDVFDVRVVSSSYEDLASSICLRPSFPDLSREKISMHTVSREMNFFRPPLTNEINALQRYFKISQLELLGPVAGAQKKVLSTTNLFEICVSPMKKELALFQTSICTRRTA